MREMDLWDSEVVPSPNLYPRLFRLVVIVYEPLEFAQGVRCMLGIAGVKRHSAKANDRCAERVGGRVTSDVCRHRGK